MDEIKYAGLANILETRLIAWEKSRQKQEDKMLECYQDVMRIARDGDTKDTGIAKAKKASGMFIGSTRNKVRSARAKINDSLFGNGKLPFDTYPTDESLRQFADVMEDIIEEQLIRMDFKRVLKAGVDTLATYGTGFIFGPFVKKDVISETKADNTYGYTQIVEQKYEFDTPYFEIGNTLDCYPDPEARKLEAGLGIFTVTMESKHTVEAWKQDGSYSNIEEAIKTSSEAINKTGSEKAGGLRANVEYWHKNDRIKVARFFGKVPERLLSDSDDTAVNVDDSGKMVDVVVIMAGGLVVKVNQSPYTRLPSLRCAYEEVPHEIWGVGVAENNAPHQKITNAAVRMYFEGKGFALLGTKSVDRSMFLPSENFVKTPGKVYQFKPGLTPEERKTAILEHIEPDITGGWLDVIRMSEQFSDDDTAITKYTQGDDSGNLNKTASGISMIMNASSLPLKEVIQNIDSDWIEPAIKELIDWDIKYLEVETVRKIHGDEYAELWKQIKQFGKSSFMSWMATGTSTFMQKEILTSKLRAFSEFALSNPATAQKVDVTELLTQTWDSMEIGRESPILKEEGDLPPEAMQAIEQIKQQAEQQIDQMGMQIEQMSKALQEAQSLQAKAQADAQIKVMLAELEATNKRDMAKQAQDFEREKIELETELTVLREEREDKRLRELAQMEKESREDAAELAALVELEKAAIPPPAGLKADVERDIAEE